MKSLIAPPEVLVNRAFTEKDYQERAQRLIDNVHDIVDKFNAQDIVEKRSLTIE